MENHEPRGSEEEEDMPDLESDATSHEQPESGEDNCPSNEPGESKDSGESGTENDESTDGQDAEDGVEDTSDEEGPDVPANPERRLHSAGTVGTWSKMMGQVWGKAKMVADKMDRVCDDQGEESDLSSDAGRAMLTKDGPRNV